MTFFLTIEFSWASNGAGLGPEDFAGDEFQINTWFVNDQRIPALAALRGGDLVAVWQSTNQAGPGLSLFGQRLDKSGALRGDEFRVNQNSAGRQDGTAVVAMPDGGFVVAWQGRPPQAGAMEIWARRFNAQAVPLTDDVLLYAHPASAQQLPVIAADGAGRLLVVWESQRQDVPDAQPGDTVSVLGMWLDTDLLPLTVPFVVNGYTAGAQRWPHVAMTPAGRAVVTWASSGQDGDGWGVFARCLSGPSTPPGPEFQVNQTIVGAQQQPRAAMHGDGSFAISWWDDTGLRLNPDFYRRVQARFYTPDCQPLGGEQQVNEDDDGIQDLPHIAATGDGGYVVAWHSSPRGGAFARQGTYARRIAATGTPVGPQFRLNQETAAFQDHPAVAAIPDGGFLGIWESLGQDGSGYGIYARVFLGPRAAALTVIEGDRQSVLAGEMFPWPLVLRVTDQWGRPLAGVEVRFTVRAGSARFANGAAEMVAITDEAGLARATLTAGHLAGTFQVVALTDQSTAQAVFSLTNEGAIPVPVFSPAGLYGLILLILGIAGFSQRSAPRAP